MLKKCHRKLKIAQPGSEKQGSRAFWNPDATKWSMNFESLVPFLLVHLLWNVSPKRFIFKTLLVKVGNFAPELYMLSSTDMQDNQRNNRWSNATKRHTDAQASNWLTR